MLDVYTKTNMLFTNLSPVDYKPTHNVYRNEHFLNAFDIHIEALDSFTSLTLEEIGYTKVKITHLLKSYLDPVEYNNWMSLIKETTESYGKVDSDIGLQTTRNSKHSNGPCIFGFSYRSHIYPTLTVYSRSVELPQIFGADTLLISAIAQHIAEVADVEGVRINWYISSARIKSRGANFFRLYMYPFTEYRYINEEFHNHVEKQWSNILADQEKKVTFSKLIKLQQEYKRKVIDRKEPETATGVPEFIVKLKEGWKV